MIFKNKKGVEMSLSVVIVAVLLLLVLAVLGFIMMRGSGNFQEGVVLCSGRCEMEASKCTGDLPLAVPMGCTYDGQPGKGKFCCQKLGP